MEWGPVIQTTNSAIYGEVGPRNNEGENRDADQALSGSLTPVFVRLPGLARKKLGLSSYAKQIADPNFEWQTMWDSGGQRN